MKRNFSPSRDASFTLVELLVAIAVFSLILGVLLQIFTRTSSTLEQVTGEVDSFQSASAAFDILNQTLTQATLNTYWDYDNEANPTTYIRKSDLHFLLINNNGSDPGIYFQAPLSRSDNTADDVSGVLNACGFFVLFGSNAGFKPPNISATKMRFRLMRTLQPTEDLSVYGSTGDTWITGVRATATPLADNIIALIAWPKLSEAQDAAGTAISSDFSYDSRTTTGVQSMQLPPVVQLTMIAIDEASAARHASSLQTIINGILAGKFTTVASYTDDLNTVEAGLTAAHFNYHVFNSSVSLRESQWSE